MILGAYFIFRRDPVGIVSSLPNSVIYLRNLHLIGRKARLANELESAEVCRRSTRAPNRKDTEQQSKSLSRLEILANSAIFCLISITGMILVCNTSDFDR